MVDKNLPFCYKCATVCAGRFRAYAAQNPTMKRNPTITIACLSGLAGTSPNEDRLRGYREAMAARQTSSCEIPCAT